VRPDQAAWLAALAAPSAASWSKNSTTDRGNPISEFDHMILRHHRAMLLGCVFSLAVGSSALAQSSINTGQPASEANLTSLVVRQQFTAAASDINGILGMHAATSLSQCPSSPVVGENCLTIGSTPYVWYKWTGAGGWGQIATINPSTGVVTPSLGPSNITASFPLVAVPSLGNYALSLNFNASLLLDGSNNLGLNLANPNTWTATQAFPAGSITNTELANSTISGISLGSNLDALTFGTHLTAGGTSYNGGAAVTISTDATSLNTVSTVVARDSSGNFSAGTITASITGHASLDLALTGGTVTGPVTFSGNDTFSGQIIATGTTAPSSAAGNTVVAGTLASTPVLSNNGQAFLYNGAGTGAVLQGLGSVADVELRNGAGGVIFFAPTGTTNLNFPSLASVTCAKSLVLDSSNNTGLAACPGSAGSIQVGASTIISGASGAFLFDNAGTLGNVSVIPAANGGAGTITGALRGNGSGLVQQAATSDLSDVTNPTAWTPTDASGVGLTFTSPSGLYTRIGKIVHAQFVLTFPTTVSAATAAIGGLPVASSSSGASFSAGSCKSNVTSNFIIGAFMAAGSANINLFSMASSPNLNSNFSAFTLSCDINYISN